MTNKIKKYNFVKCISSNMDCYVSLRRIFCLMDQLSDMNEIKLMVCIHRFISKNYVPRFSRRCVLQRKKRSV